MMNLILPIYFLVFSAFSISCTKAQDIKDYSILAKGITVSKPLSIEEIKVRSKVIKLPQKNHYALDFESDSTEQILLYKPAKVQIQLPYFSAPTFFVSLHYRDLQILSDFSFPEGWIDSAELEGIFFISKTTGWKIPIDTIYSPLGGNQYVIKVSEGRSIFVQIHILKFKDDGVIVIGNLKEGDTLITSRQGDIVSDMPVRVSL